MKEMIVNGKTIKTNYGQTYSVVKGDRKEGWDSKQMEWIKWNEDDRYKSIEGEEHMLERLVDEGYTVIRFVESTTNVRGYHKVWAYAKRG